MHVCVLTDILKEYVWAKRKVESTEQQCLFILTAGLHTCSLLWYHCKHVAGLTGRMAHLIIRALRIFDRIVAYQA